MGRGIIIVDHGSRLPLSNALLAEVAAAFHARDPQKYPIVEPAHMELAEPTIAQAYDRCVARGAEEIVVCPYFLGPGRHWTEDIPRLVKDAAGKHPGTTWKLARPLGLDPLMLDLLHRRIEEA
ncbi:MAG: CbiX/SirB N-terminal domain-containing protein [Planctomycetales bacterium]